MTLPTEKIEAVMEAARKVRTFAGTIATHGFTGALHETYTPYNDPRMTFDEAITALVNDLSLCAEALASRKAGGVRRFRHKKRGTEYALIGFGRMQAEDWYDAAAPKSQHVDMREVAIYRSATDPTEIWVRPREEFEDGRFEELSALEPGQTDQVSASPPPPSGALPDAEPVAWHETNDVLPEPGWRFIVVHSDGSGAFLAFRHDAGYFDQDGDDFDVLPRGTTWAYTPAHVRLWAENCGDDCLSLPDQPASPPSIDIDEAAFRRAKEAWNDARPDISGNMDAALRAALTAALKGAQP